MKKFILQLSLIALFILGVISIGLSQGFLISTSRQEGEVSEKPLYAQDVILFRNQKVNTIGESKNQIKKEDEYEIVSAAGYGLRVYKNDGTTLLGKFHAYESRSPASQTLGNLSLPSIVYSLPDGTADTITHLDRYASINTKSYFSGANCSGTEYWERNGDFNLSYACVNSEFSFFWSPFHYSYSNGSVYFYMYGYNCYSGVNPVGFASYRNSPSTACVNTGGSAILQAASFYTGNPVANKKCGDSDCKVKP